jgi:hypothetical protein
MICVSCYVHAWHMGDLQFSGVWRMCDLQRALEETEASNREHDERKSKKRRREHSDVVDDVVDRTPEAKASTKTGEASPPHEDISGLVRRVLKKHGTITLVKLAKMVRKKLDSDVTSEQIAQQVGSPVDG